MRVRVITYLDLQHSTCTDFLIPISVCVSSIFSPANLWTAAKLDPPTSVPEKRAVVSNYCSQLLCARSLSLSLSLSLSANFKQSQTTCTSNKVDYLKFSSPSIHTHGSCVAEWFRLSIENEVLEVSALDFLPLLFFVPVSSFCPSMLVTWCFEPSQPLGIILGLTTNLSLFLSYSAQSYNISNKIVQLSVKTFHT